MKLRTHTHLVCHCYCVAVVGGVVQWVGWLVCVRFIGFFFVLVDAVGGRTIFNLIGCWVSYCVCNCFYFFGVLILVRD